MSFYSCHSRYINISNYLKAYYKLSEVFHSEVQKAWIKNIDSVAIGNQLLFQYLKHSLSEDSFHCH